MFNRSEAQEKLSNSEPIGKIVTVPTTDKTGDVGRNTYTAISGSAEAVPDATPRWYSRN